MLNFRKVHIMGLGPVGLGTAWCLLQKGITCQGVDLIEQAVMDCKSFSYTRTPQLRDDLSQFAKDKKWKIQTNLTLPESATVMLCIGTPYSDSHKEYNLTPLRNSLQKIVAAKSDSTSVHIIIRSTVLPGTTEKFINEFGHIPNLYFSYWPEFLRELHLKEDLQNPPLQVVAHQNEYAEKNFEALLGIHHKAVAFKEAEALKLASNAFHALKIAFANEVGRWGEKMGFNASQVMNIFVTDTKLNISKNYLQPGSAFGGSCLEKDLQALRDHFQTLNLQSPIIRETLTSNELQKSEDAKK